MRNSLKNCWKRVKKPHCNHGYGYSLLVLYSLTCVLIENWAEKCGKYFFGVVSAFFEVAKLHVWEIGIKEE